MTIESPCPDAIESIDALPSLLEGERGAIVPSMAHIVDRGGGRLAPDGLYFDPDAVRGALLFFDRIVHPGNSFIGFGSLAHITGEIESVSDARVNFATGLRANPFSAALRATFEALEQSDPERWTMVRGREAPPIPQGLLGGINAFKVRLLDAIPVPDRSVPFEDIYNYRQRRADELLALRSYLEGIALEVAQQGFGGLAESRAFENLKRAIDSHTQAISEANFLKRLTGVEVKFNWTSLAQSLFAGGAAFSGNFTASAIAGLGIAASSLSVESSVGLSHSSEVPRPFDYVFKARTDL